MTQGVPERGEMKWNFVQVIYRNSVTEDRVMDLAGNSVCLNVSIPAPRIDLSISPSTHAISNFGELMELQDGRSLQAGNNAKSFTP